MVLETSGRAGLSQASRDLKRIAGHVLPIFFLSNVGLAATFNYRAATGHEYIATVATTMIVAQLCLQVAVVVAARRSLEWRGGIPPQRLSRLRDRVPTIGLITTLGAALASEFLPSGFDDACDLPGGGIIVVALLAFGGVVAVFTVAFLIPSAPCGRTRSGPGR
jgi:amino acid transporter